MKRRAKTVAAVAGVPVELVDLDAPVWHDQAAYHVYMVGNGWSLPAAERMGRAISPGNRRRNALAGWAVDAGVTVTDRPRQPDWNRLAAMGLV
jgi:hypothetical protein